ncbi:hypothetical protein AX16_005477 [Volvariella volvacea WC 439]|nr:hypothetical protein AX16_005477 [Volvariella volvacea WC 439]
MTKVDVPPELKRAKDLWFEDGNVILQAQQTVFRLYKGLLCMHSSFFRDKLAASDQQGDQPYTFIELDDTSQDAGYFFMAIYHSGFFEPPPSTIDFSIIAAVYRLSTKYHVNFLRRRSVMHFETSYPTTLENWTTRDRRRTIPAIDDMPFAILNLARELNLSWVLPAVHYCIATHPLEKIFEGVTFREQKIELHLDDIRASSIGRARLLQLQIRYALQVMNEGLDNAECEEEDHCASVRTEGLQSISTWETMGYLDLRADNTDVFKGMCEPCSSWYRKYYEGTRKELWGYLPEMFGLGSWEDLKREQQGILSLPD